MKPASERFKEVLNSVKMQEPKCNVIQNVDASSSNNIDIISENLISQIYSPVRWEEIMNSFSKLSIRNCIECGPGKVLSGLIKRSIIDASVISLDNYESFQNKEDFL